MDKESVQKMIDEALQAAAAFPTRKYGDTPSDANQLTPKKWVDDITSVLAASIIGTRTSIAGIANFNIFGAGIHSVANADTINSIAGIVPSASIYTLDKDVFFTNINFSNGARIKTNGYRVFATGTISIPSTKSIYWDGNNGISGSVSGFGGASLFGISVPGALGGSQGGDRGPATNNQVGQPGGDGVVGTATTNSIGSSSTGPAFTPSGGTGGIALDLAGGPGGSTGSLAAATSTTQPPYTLLNFETTTTGPVASMLYQTSASAPGGGGGGGGASKAGGSPNSGAGGRGGGAGSNGGTIVIFANTITNTATGGISANGGNGGDGENGLNATEQAFATGGGGGGGGGNGGTGGVILLVYRTSVQSGTFTVSGGTAGVGGSGGNPGSFAGGGFGLSGKIGNDGNSGQVWTYQV